MRSPTTMLVPAVCALLGATLLASAPSATSAGDNHSSHAAKVSRRAHVMPRHDLVGAGAKVSANYKVHYRYAEGWMPFRKHHRPRGVSAKFSVHKPKQLPWRVGDHSLAEMALIRPHSRRLHPSYIETGWVRGNGHKGTQLFVFWWGLKGKPHCYNRCGFHRRGPGIKPGAHLKPGSKIKLTWVHGHHRWNLYVNNKRSGYYPDKLWSGKFKRIKRAQIFGEVATVNKTGKCADMGNGHFPKKHRGAMIWHIKLLGKHTGRPRFRKGTVSRPKQYRYRHINGRAFRYGGPGAC